MARPQGQTSLGYLSLSPPQKKTLYGHQDYVATNNSELDHQANTILAGAIEIQKSMPLYIW